MLSLPSIIKNPLAELANLREIHENSKVSNKQFQPDVEEQKWTKFFAWPVSSETTFFETSSSVTYWR